MFKMIIMSLFSIDPELSVGKRFSELSVQRHDGVVHDRNRKLYDAAAEHAQLHGRHGRPRCARSSAPGGSQSAASRPE